ncbi:hypothetical protein [Canibacter oris]|uniref:Uncharacterized protein n=1 Tax=Canibacter oris TaxID=1365628 RepID=A0A840DKR3_9MICO|nr:hypothetical protein [Canibacter oris]MBB4072062.1 hypothetical protein [Canibacter oris]
MTADIPLMGWETAHLYKNMNNEPPLLFDYPGLPEWKKGTYAAWEIEICQKELTARWLFARDHGVETKRGVWPRPVPEYARQFYYDLVEMPAWEVCAPILAANKPEPARRRHPILDSPFASDDYKAGLKAQLLAAGEIDDDGYYIEPTETGPVVPAEWAAPPTPAAPSVSPWQPSAQPSEQTLPRPAVDPQQPAAIPPAMAATVPLQTPAPVAPVPKAAREKVNGTMPAVAMTYMVYFEEHGIIKVGRAYKNSRWRSLVARGAELIFLDRDTIAKQEQAALSLLRQVFPPAFNSENDELAQQLLPLGRGFTECFKVASVDEFNLAFNLYLQGVDEHAAEAAEVAAEYRLHRKAARSAAASGEVHGSGNEDACRRRGALQARPAPDTVDDLPPRSAYERGGAAEPPAAADTERLATCLSGAGRGMVSAGGAVASGSACEAVTAGGAAESATAGGASDANNRADNNSGSTEADAATSASHAANLAGSRAGKLTGHRRTGGSKHCTGRSAAAHNRRADTRTSTKTTSRVLPAASKTYTGASFTKSAGAGVAVLCEASALRYRSSMRSVSHSALQLRNAARKSARGAGAVVGAGYESGRDGRGVQRRAGNYYGSGYTGGGVQSPAAVPSRAGNGSSGGVGAVLNNSGAEQGGKPVFKRDFGFHESFMKSSWLWRERVRARAREGGCARESASVSVGPAVRREEFLGV